MPPPRGSGSACRCQHGAGHRGPAGVYRGKASIGVSGRPAGIAVYDDFAHHPTAIHSTLHALRAASTSGKLIAMIEPRSNTMRLGEHKAHLVACAADADLALWLDPPGLDWDLSHTVASASGQEAFRQR